MTITCPSTAIRAGAARALDRLTRPPEPAPASAPDTRPTVADVLAATAEVMEMTPAELVSPVRATERVLARQVAMYVAVVRLGHGATHTARAIGRDHTTVIHGVRRIHGVIHDDRILHLVEVVAVRAASKCEARLAAFRALSDALAQNGAGDGVRSDGGGVRPRSSARVLVVDGRPGTRGTGKAAEAAAAAFLAGRSVAEIAAERRSTCGDVVHMLRVRRIRPGQQGSAV